MIVLYDDDDDTDYDEHHYDNKEHTFSSVDFDFITCSSWVTLRQNCVMLTCLITLSPEEGRKEGWMVYTIQTACDDDDTMGHCDCYCTVLDASSVSPSSSPASASSSPASPSSSPASPASSSHHHHSYLCEYELRYTCQRGLGGVAGAVDET